MKREIWAGCAVVALLAGMVLWGASSIVPAAITQPMEQGGEGAVLILDAGHGGEDGGAVAPSGAEESQINLDIVLRLEQMMAFLGTQPMLTRREDVSLHDEGCDTLREKKMSDLRRRVQMVNETANALLLSVHQNYFTDSRYAGAQVFYRTGDVSRQWGERAQQALRQVLDADNDREAMALANSVYLFEHVQCPAILVECGFLSNGEEASLLQTDGYQKQIALALAGACFRQLGMDRAGEGEGLIAKDKNHVLLHPVRQ